MEIYLAKYYIFSFLAENKLFEFNAVKRGPVPDLAPERGEWGAKEPEGQQPLAKGKEVKKVNRIRQEFPEAWLWTETEAKYMEKKLKLHQLLCFTQRSPRKFFTSNNHATTRLGVKVIFRKRIYSNENHMRSSNEKLRKSS